LADAIATAALAPEKEERSARGAEVGVAMVARGLGMVGSTRVRCDGIYNRARMGDGRAHLSDGAARVGGL
jgi:hypothetical protein